MSSNFFAVLGGAVHTAGEGVLEGTVRQVALDVAAREGIPVVLQPPSLKVGVVGGPLGVALLSTGATQYCGWGVQPCW